MGNFHWKNIREKTPVANKGYKRLKYKTERIPVYGTINVVVSYGKENSQVPVYSGEDKVLYRYRIRKSIAGKKSII